MCCPVLEIILERDDNKKHLDLGLTLWLLRNSSVLHQYITSTAFFIYLLNELGKTM